MFLRNNPGFSEREGVSRKEGQGGVVSEAVAEVFVGIQKAVYLSTADVSSSSHC